MLQLCPHKNVLGVSLWCPVSTAPADVFHVTHAALRDEAAPTLYLLHPKLETCMDIAGRMAVAVEDVGIMLTARAILAAIHATRQLAR